MSETTQQEFGKLRSFFWPVYSFEIKKLLPMFLMFFFISFNYTILRDTKDVLIVTTSGAETIPFIKLLVVPSAIIFMLTFAKLSNMLSKERLFYVTLTPFIIFFGLFATVLYPNREALHPVASADFLQNALPGGLSFLVECYRNWTYTLFYILAELWGSAVLSLMFWGFANDIMKVTEAKRFYNLLGLGANVALLVSGTAIIYFSDIRASLPASVDAWQVSLNYLMGMVCAAGLTIMGIYWWINRNVLTDPKFYNPDEVKTKKKKAKLSIGESFKYLATSKYILCITILVLSYGICINLVEVTWKAQLKLQYPNPNDYSTFMGGFSRYTGMITICMMFIGGYIIRRFGWGPAAILTPTVLLITGVAFFSFVIFRDSLGGFIAHFGTTPLMMAVVIGMIQNIMSKSTKYSLFDPTKEMAYIPLDDEAKVKGKAAIDVVGARLGKSGGSFINATLITVFGSLAAVTPYVAMFTIAFIVAWMIGVRALSKQFNALTSPSADSATAPAKEKLQPAQAT